MKSSHLLLISHILPPSSCLLLAVGELPLILTVSDPASLSLFISLLLYIYIYIYYFPYTTYTCTCYAIPCTHQPPTRGDYTVLMVKAVLTPLAPPVALPIRQGIILSYLMCYTSPSLLFLLMLLH